MKNAGPERNSVEKGQPTLAFLFDDFSPRTHRIHCTSTMKKVPDLEEAALKLVE